MNQNKAANKAIKKSKKLTQAKVKIPKKQIKTKQRTVDPVTGNKTVRLHFEEIDKPKPTTHLKHEITHAPLNKASSKIHSELSKNEADNVQIKAVNSLTHKGEKAAKLAQSSYRSHKLKPYKNLAKAQKQSQKADLKYLYAKDKAENPTSNPVSRYQQKRKLKRQYINAQANSKKAKTAEKATTSTIKKLADTIKKAAMAIVKNPKVLAIVFAVLFVVCLLFSMFSSLFLVFQAAFGTVIATSYTSDDSELIATNNYYITLETALQNQLDSIETTYPNYDEYQYSTIIIAHDPHALASYLTAKFIVYTAEEMKDELEIIFALQYQLTINEVIETRYETQILTGFYDTVDEYGNAVTVEYEYEEDVAYEYKILEITLAGKSLSDIVQENLTADEYEHYSAVYACSGNKPLIFGGITSGDIDLDNLPDVSESGYMWPTIGAYEVSSEYGYRDASISGSSFHGGIDIINSGGSTGLPIIASKAGTVIIAQTWDKGGYGVYVKLDHGDGTQTVYGHMLTGSILVSVGQEVEQGQQLGCIGATGNVTGPHLHFEVIVDGNKVNPRYFIGYYTD